MTVDFGPQLSAQALGESTESFNPTPSVAVGSPACKHPPPFTAHMPLYSLALALSRMSGGSWRRPRRSLPPACKQSRSEALS